VFSQSVIIGLLKDYWETVLTQFRCVYRRFRKYKFCRSAQREIKFFLNKSGQVGWI